MTITRYYHVCNSCDAKFFAAHSVEDCPRCGKISGSCERQVPPWMKHEEESRENEDQQQREYLRAHVAQLRARQCPGCGETELF